MAQRQQALEIGATQLQQQQYELAQRKAINDAYKNAVTPGQNGAPPTFDTDKLGNTLAQAGYGSAVPSILNTLNEYQKNHNDAMEAQQKVDVGNRDAAGAFGYAAKQAGYDPGFVSMGLQHQLADPRTSPQQKQQFQQMQQAIEQDPTKVKPLVDSLIAMSPKYTELDSQAAANQARVAAAQTSQQRLQAELPGGPLANVDRAEMQDYLQKHPGKGPADFAAYKAGLAPNITASIAARTGAGGSSGAVAQQFGMTPEALDQAAEKYSTTGQLPPAGRSGAGLAMARAIMNRAGELHPGQTLAANSAEYKANAGSLDKLQSQFDTVNAFENTAIKNLDRLVQNGAKIPDLGTRFANVPVRQITEKMIGTPAMAKFKADLLTAQTESAKVLNSANAGGVLSDSARKEAEDILSGNLPYPAMVAAVNELKNDMGNRHQSYQEQIQDIKGRLGKTNSQQSPAAKKSGSFNWSSFPEHK
jgi:hypothetical protein